MTQQQDPDPAASKVSYPVQEIVTLRRRMERSLAGAYVGASPTGDGFNIFVDDVMALLPTTLPRQNVYDSLSHLAGQRLTVPILRSNLWRLAGNLKRLRAKPVPPWNHQPFPEWVPAAIVSARRRRNNAGRLGYLFGFQVLAGLSCSMVISRFWTTRFCHYLSRHMGFKRQDTRPTSRAPSTCVFRHPREFVTLRLGVLVEPRLCSFAEPAFEKVRIGSAHLKWNREQLAFRDRFDAAHACPEGYPNARRCYLCHVGFNRCRAGCHAKDYEARPCDGCGREDAQFDPELPAGLCVECYELQQVERDQA